MTVNIMDEDHGIQAVVFYVDIESGGNVSNLGLNAGERGRVALWISRSGGFSHVSDSCVAWSSSDPEVVSIDESGIITAHKPEVATMTAMADRSTGFYTASYDITVLGGVFSDVDGRTSHYGDIMWLADRGISSGFPDGTFRPYDNIARCDMAAFLYRLADEPPYDVTDEDTSAFSDVGQSTPHLKEVCWLASEGISTGFPDKTFRPYESIARCDMAAFLHRLNDRVL